MIVYIGFFFEFEISRVTPDSVSLNVTFDRRRIYFQPKLRIELPYFGGLGTLNEFTTDIQYVEYLRVFLTLWHF